MNTNRPHLIHAPQSIEQLALIQSNSPTNTTATIASTQPSSTPSTNTGPNGESNELALYLFNRIPAGLQVMHIIETSYSETECCFQYVRTTKTKTNYDPHNTINTIEVYRGRRPNQINDTINETYI